MEAGLLSRLSEPLAHRGPDGEGQWIEGPVGLACQLMRVTPESLHETQPLVHPSGAVIVFDGRLDNREELLGLLKGAWGAETASPDPALVLAAYVAFGEGLAERLNGDFALAIYDPPRHRLLLARDAIGIRPLYYCRTGDTFLFASEIKAILAHPGVSPQPNDDVIAEFIFGGPGQAGTNLFYRGVRPAPGPSGGPDPPWICLRRYWDFDPTRQIRSWFFSEYAEAFQHHIQRSGGAAAPQRLSGGSVQVSGGLRFFFHLLPGRNPAPARPEKYPSLVA